MLLDLLASLNRQQESFAALHHTSLAHYVWKHTIRLPLNLYPSMKEKHCSLQAARKIHIGKFRAGKSTILITTDVAARGLDIPLLDNVINFDFPAKPKLFVHRGGRAARAGRKGSALSLVSKEELPYMLDLHLFLSRPTTPAPVTSVTEAAAAAESLDPSASLFGTFPQVISCESNPSLRFGEKLLMRRSLNKNLLAPHSRL